MSNNVEGLNLIVIRSKDIERSADFYGLVGLELQPEKHGKGPKHFAATLGKTVLEIYPAGKRKPTTDIRLGFLVTDMNVVLNALDLDESPKQTEYGLQLIINDPDGNTVELTQT